MPEWGGGPRGRGVKAFRGPQTLGNSDFCEGGGSHGEFEGGETCSALGFNRVALAVAQQTDGGPRGCRETSWEATAEMWVSHEGVVPRPHLFHASVTPSPCPEASAALTGGLSPITPSPAVKTLILSGFIQPKGGCHANARLKCESSLALVEPAPPLPPPRAKPASFP